MTEVERVARLLARRLSASRRYGDEDIPATAGQGGHFIQLPLLDAEVLLFVEPDVDGDRVRGVLSFLLRRDGKGYAVHLNHWFREEWGDTPVPVLVSRIWAKFWADELENEGLNRVLWMHGPDIPPLPEDVPVQERMTFLAPQEPEPEPPPVPVATTLAEELAAVLDQAPSEPPARARKVPLVDASVLDLFGE